MLQKNKTPLQMKGYSNMPVVIEQNVPLHDKNWFGTGGNARYFCAPINADQFVEALDWVAKQKCPVHILGQGANTLISDDGFDGLIIVPKITDINITDLDEQSCLVHAGAGVTIRDLIAYCLEHSVIGLEEFGGIPGTVGGSVYNNLHYFEFSLSDFLVDAQVIEKETGLVTQVDKTWLSLGYDHSKLHEKLHYVASVTFKLKRVTPLDAAFAKGRYIEIVRHRAKRYPTARTCGCFFRNFHEYEISKPINGKKLVYVAYYLDNVGIKGNLRIGNACVSHQHANMIVTSDGAKTADIVAVARTMQEKVYQTFGLLPQPECELVGFKEYPLHASFF
jgi:UDP-N-acetylmuramate dehydrogenase